MQEQLSETVLNQKISRRRFMEKVGLTIGALVFGDKAFSQTGPNIVIAPTGQDIPPHPNTPPVRSPEPIVIQESIPEISNVNIPTDNVARRLNISRVAETSQICTAQFINQFGQFQCAALQNITTNVDTHTYDGQPPNSDFGHGVARISTDRKSYEIDITVPGGAHVPLIVGSFEGSIDPVTGVVNAPRFVRKSRCSDCHTNNNTDQDLVGFFSNPSQGTFQQGLSIDAVVEGSGVNKRYRSVNFFNFFR